MISADPSGEFTIEGICIPENVQSDFKEFFNWLNEYMKTPADRTVMNVKLDYFNTSTAAILLNIFRTISALKEKGKDVAVNWYYEEDDMEIEESGHDYASIISIEFNVLPFTK